MICRILSLHHSLCYQQRQSLRTTTMGNRIHSPLWLLSSWDVVFEDRFDDLRSRCRHLYAGLDLCFTLVPVVHFRRHILSKDKRRKLLIIMSAGLQAFVVSCHRLSCTRTCSTLSSLRLKKNEHENMEDNRYPIFPYLGLMMSSGMLQFNHCSIHWTCNDYANNLHDTGTTLKRLLVSEQLTATTVTHWLWYYFLVTQWEELPPCDIHRLWCYSTTVYSLMTVIYVQASGLWSLLIWTWDQQLWPSSESTEYRTVLRLRTSFDLLFHSLCLLMVHEVMVIVFVVVFVSMMLRLMMFLVVDLLVDLFSPMFLLMVLFLVVHLKINGLTIMPCDSESSSHLFMMSFVVMFFLMLLLFVMLFFVMMDFFMFFFMLLMMFLLLCRQAMSRHVTRRDREIEKQALYIPWSSWSLPAAMTIRMTIRKQTGMCFMIRWFVLFSGCCKWGTTAEWHFLK